MVFTADQLNSLMYWVAPRDSGIVFGCVLVCLLACRYISAISVVGNLCLALVTATTSFRIYKAVLAAVNKSQDGHPFRSFLDLDVNVSSGSVTGAVNSLFSFINGLLSSLKSALLVESVLETAKFAFLMYLLTILGELFNGLTLVTLVWVAAFSLPRVYRDNQTKIDEALLPLKEKFGDLSSKIGAVIPSSLKKEE